MPIYAPQETRFFIDGREVTGGTVHHVESIPAMSFTYVFRPDNPEGWRTFWRSVILGRLPRRRRKPASRYLRKGGIRK
jgi:hypothetical protein